MAAPETLPWLARYDAGKYQPVTFLERGVVLPFTTPTLLGGRIRPGERKSPELVSGQSGRGGRRLYPALVRHAGCLHPDLARPCALGPGRPTGDPHALAPSAR
ncbi:hypothetical protein [Dankookia sp. P2]|uniref:hypothetical protein n=1 Tax=Dankookia sp. P2 TaxID=3423955 RepID=UPI003D66CA25